MRMQKEHKIIGGPSDNGSEAEQDVVTLQKRCLQRLGIYERK
jgi:hypothetical protein